MMFVPSVRSINPVTGTDWEGVDVASDIKASANSALDVAQLAALNAMILAETDPVWQRKLKDHIHELE